DEVRRPALHQMRPEVRVAAGRRAVRVPRLRNAAAYSLRVVRLTHHDLRGRAFLAQHARHALECAARAETRDEVVEPLAAERFENLRRRRTRVDVGIRLVLELAAEEPAMLLRQLHRLREHAGAL